MTLCRKISGLILALAVSGTIHATAKTNIAHRGASGYLPEHTLPAAGLAVAMEADFVEPDLVLTSDNQIIVLHDLKLDTTTDVDRVFPTRKREDGHWYAIDFTLEEIKKLKVGERRLEDGKAAAYPGRFPSDSLVLSIPTFGEFISLIQGMNHSMGKATGIYPEIKEPAFHKKAGKDITRIVYEEIKRAGYENNLDQIFIQCFDPAELKRLKFEFKTKIPLIQLIGINSWWDQPPADYEDMISKKGLKEVAAYAQGIGAWTGHILRKHQHGNIMTSTGLVALAQAAGLLVHAYTARSDALPPGITSYNQLMDLLFHKENVNGVFSDFPDLTDRFLQMPAGGKTGESAISPLKSDSLASP